MGSRWFQTKRGAGVSWRKKCYFGGFKKVSGSRFQVSGIRNALLDDGCWRLTGGGRWGAFSWLFKVIKVILRGFWGVFREMMRDERCVMKDA
jgi:hypothetical protein